MDGMRKRSPAVLALVLLFLTLLNVQVFADPITHPYLLGMALGNGHDSYSLSNKLRCVNFEPETTNDLTANFRGGYYFDLVETNDDLLDRINVNGGLSFSYGILSASAEGQILRQNELSSFDVNVLAMAEVINRWVFATQVQLKPEFQRLLVDNPGEFLQSCGDFYVAGVAYGGDFYNLIRISTYGLSDFNAVAGAVSAGFGPFAGSISASNETLAVLRARNATIRGYSSGSASGFPLSIESMMTTLENFPREVSASGGIMSEVWLEPYPARTSVFDQRIWNMAMKRLDFTSLGREIQYIQDNPGQFYMHIRSWAPRLVELKNEADAAIARLDQGIQACRSNRGACDEVTGIRDPQAVRMDLPPRFAGTCGRQRFDMGSDFRISIHPLYGNCSRSSFADRNVNSNPTLTITSNIAPMTDGKQIDLSTTVEIKEPEDIHGRNTCFNGQQTRVLRSNVDEVYPNCYLSPPFPSGDVTVQIPASNYNWTWHYGTGIIDRAECLSNTQGDDEGDLGCRIIDFRTTFDITLGHDEDKGGPNVYWPNQPTIQKPLVQKVALKTPKPFAKRIIDIRNATGKNVQLIKTTTTVMPKPTPTLYPRKLP